MPPTQIIGRLNEKFGDSRGLGHVGMSTSSMRTEVSTAANKLPLYRRYHKHSHITI